MDRLQTEHSQKGRQLVDVETGQLYEDVTLVRTQRQQEILDNEKKLAAIRAARGKNQPTFYFANNKKLKGANKDMPLTMKQYGYIAVLGCYMDYEEGILKMTEDSNVPMTKPELKKVLKISKDHTVNKLIKDFEKLGVLEVKDVRRFGKEYKAFHLKKDLVFRKGKAEKRSVKGTTRVFIEALKSVYAEEKVTPADVGLILRCLPYVNIYSNLLTHNPEELEPSKDEAMTVGELAEQLGMTEKALFTKLSAARFNDMHVFAKITVGRNKILKMNPLVARRKYEHPERGSYSEFMIKPSSKKTNKKK